MHTYEWNFDGIGAMIPGHGYQAKMNTDKTILFEGITSHQKTIQFYWNLVGICLHT